IELSLEDKNIYIFKKFFKNYNRILYENSMIDYDDMLYFAVKILESDKAFLKYYQEICKFIIEDEAQDSTDIQQRLISLLGGKYNNIVRCGDINQAITSTFTNSNLESFKSFLKNNKIVEMNSSQRCTNQIYSLANSLIQEAIKNPLYKNAFYDILIKGTANNPKNDISPSYKVFEKDIDEKLFILNQIKTIKNENPKASIAILLRLNSQVNEYNEFLISNGFQTSIRTDSLGQKEIYNIIRSILAIINAPLNNENIINLAKIYRKRHISNITLEDLDFIQNLEKPFINEDVDALYSEGLSQLYWDISYWFNESVNDIEELALQIGSYYSKNSVEKSNTYLISSFIKRLKDKNESLNDLLKKLDFAALKPMSAYKFFDEEVQENDTNINIMTMHKSKGDEFDYVFIPMLNEENYPIELENVKLKTGGHFVQTIKAQIENSQVQTPELLKKEQIFETMRLLYVGITRAKQGLFISSSRLSKRNKKLKISEFIEKLFNNFS
ncbi:ATP-dependent helicase, partial [bacterium]|nr:ATP-dependent helicase [bacterium]